MTDLDRKLPDSAADTAPAAAEATPALPEDALIIVPMRNLVLFPGFIAPITIGRPSSVAAAQAAMREQSPIGVLLQRDPATEDPTPEQLHTVGTSATIVRYLTAPDGSHHLVCQGEQRFRVREFLPDLPYLAARVELLPDDQTESPELEARLARMKARTAELLELQPAASPELPNTVQAFGAAGALADFLASLIE
ncbi:MAG: LON peptidase substrate-binding domain-containing protein, partial [Thauera phenolivorans]|nr:LON peptidase substrate-binding domain-containing protein [Thauera phenolivorans]